MNIGLIDVDSHNHPSLPLMKLSAYHKSIGDTVEMYRADSDLKYDRVYMSKVFTFTPDYPDEVKAKEVVRGGTGYFYPDGGDPLPNYVEHIYPDYSLYYDEKYCFDTKDTAYGFLTRGCPRGCGFCIVKDKEGRMSHKVADLSEFWRGQRNINILDPNFFACKDWRELAQQLIDSGSYIEFSQGIDIRTLTDEMIDYLMQMKIKVVHFAWDRYEDKDIVVPRLKHFKERTGINKRKCIVYLLTNYDTTLEQDLERVYTVRDIGMHPYIMRYNSSELKRGCDLNRLASWVNNRRVFDTCKRFEDYTRKKVKE